MNQPRLYAENNDLPFKEAVYILKKYSYLIRCKTDIEQNVLDVGCGDGRTTTELLYPLFENVRKFVGADISPEMIEFAEERHRKKNLSFMQLDISTKQLDVDLEEKFDHIFSFFCINWIQDQRQCASNVYNMLKPGGDIFLLFLVTSSIYEIYVKLSTNKIWGEHMKNFKEYMSPYHYSENPVKEYKDLLCQVGFDVNICEIIDRSYTFQDVISWKKFALSINPFLGKMSDDVREEFAKDMLKEFQALNCSALKNKCNEEPIQNQNKLLVVHASKPM